MCPRMWVVSLNEGRIEKKEFRQAERAITGRYIAVSTSRQSVRDCPWQSGGEREREREREAVLPEGEGFGRWMEVL